MIKFLDLNTGYSFDGLWNDDQTKGYIFWFPNEQSVNITYTMPICMLTTENKSLNLKFESNDFFAFVSHLDTTTTIDGFEFDVPKYSPEFTTTPEKINDKYYVHVVNVACVSKYDGEFLCNINIEGEGFIKIGADFYDENEALKINLANFGVEIPDTIQKAIYDSNVHEDYVDNILLNRKFKELLSNYWDIIANKGSYKSIYNSLKWFEWGDLIRLREIWKRKEADKNVFDDREIISVIRDKINETYENSVKTMFLSLYCSRYSELDTYDSEFNPELQEIIMKWSLDDIRLKIALLAQFFGTFFLPIHLSILHATVEDKVFTNTIKANAGSFISRYDCIGDFSFVKSNIKDGDLYKLDNISACVTSNTKFAHELGFGVDKFPTDGLVNKEMFDNQYYTGVGVIIPISISIPNQYKFDFVKKIIVDCEEKHMEFDCKIPVRKNFINIDFNFLAKEAKTYNINMTFLTSTSKTITKLINFTVEDIDNVVINVYKVTAKNDAKGFTYSDFLNTENSEYLFRIQEKLDKNPPYNYYLQYLPCMGETNPLFKDYKGIKLNRTVIIKVESEISGFDLTIIREMFKNYLEFTRKDDEGNIKYFIFVSKYFYEPFPNGFKDKIKELDGYNVIRDELGFYPQLHDLVRMSGIKEDNYTISQYDAVCCVPEIAVDSKTVKPLKYGKEITDVEWIFTNVSKNNVIYHPASSRQPFVVDSKKSIEPGYYDISFKYSLADGVIRECKLDSAFRIKSI